MRSYLGVEVPDDTHGVLQDIHWSGGAFGYFPTYALGNLIAAQLWARIGEQLPDLDGRIAAGDFEPLRAWLREHVHRYGRMFCPRRRSAAPRTRISTRSRSSTIYGPSTPGFTRVQRVSSASGSATGSGNGSGERRRRQSGR